jgi:selenium metabolism protein YedF
MTIINAKGLPCPKPLILAKKALKEVSEDEIFILETDSETSMQNVKKFLEDNKTKVIVDEQAGIFQIKAKKNGNLNNDEVVITEDISKIENELVQEQEIGKHVYVFNTFGVQTDDLGQMLTTGFLDTILEVEPLPKAIVFYHQAVKMAIDRSPYLEELRKLESSGIELLICGSCVNFYNIADRIKVGTVSNAYTILKAKTDASHLIYP